MAGFAVGRKAYGYCDRCGFRYDQIDLRGETLRGKPVNNKVCPTCWDDDHPQNFVGLQDTSTKPLKWTRPDTSIDESRKLTGFNPVGNVGTLLTISLSNVTVTTS